MADYRDTFTSEIYVNQSQAQDAVEKYTKKLADLNKQLEEIDKSEEGWEKRERKLQRQIKATEGSLNGVQTGVENYQKAMNSLDGRSINNLIKLKKQLNAEIRKLTPGTEEYINHQVNGHKNICRFHQVLADVRHADPHHHRCFDEVSPSRRRCGQTRRCVCRCDENHGVAARGSGGTG